MRRDRREVGADPGVVAAVLPALALVLGCQAWRAALAQLASCELSAWPVTVVAAAFLGVPLAPLLAQRHGAARVAAGCVAVLAAARLLAALVGPSAAPLYGWLGTAAFAAYLTLWPGCATSRRQAGHAFTLGLSLHLLDRLLTGTVDLLDRPGVGPAALAVALSAPVLWLAWRGLRGERGESRLTALPLALPFALVALTLCLAHPVRVAERTGWSVAATFLVMALANVAGVALAGLSDQFLRAAFARRSRPRPMRILYQVWRTGLSLVVLAGLLGLSRGALAVAVWLGPAAVAINLGPLQRSRQIGRPRRLGAVLPLAAWWLGAALAAGSGRYLWPCAVALLVLLAMATVAMWHQERPDPSHELVEWWPAAGHLALLLAAAVPCYLGEPDTVGQPLADNHVRLYVLDLGGDVPSTARQLQQARRAARQLDDEGLHPPELVALVGAERSRGLRFDDGAWWLSRRLGLVLRVPAEGDLALLSRRPPLETTAVADECLTGLWWLPHDSGLGVAAVAARRPWAQTLAAAGARLAEAPRRVIAGRLSAGWVPPDGYSDLLEGHGGDLVLLGGDGVTLNAVASAPGVLVADLACAP